MSADLSAPAVLDVPRCIELLRAQAGMAEEAYGEFHVGEELRRLAAALPALVEAGALVDAMGEWLIANRKESALLNWHHSGFDVALTRGSGMGIGICSDYKPTLRAAIADVLLAAPALREEASRE